MLIIITIITIIISIITIIIIIITDALLYSLTKFSQDIYDAKNAVDHLSGFNVCGRYLIVLYYQQSKMIQAADNNMKRKELDELKSKFGIKTEG